MTTGGAGADGPRWGRRSTTLTSMVRRVTAADVAARAGASVSSVSLFVNGKAEGRLSPELSQRIARAISDLGYRPNAKASSLAKGQPISVAYVCPDVANPFFSLMLGALADGLPAGLELSLTVPQGGGDYDLHTVERTLAGHVAVLLLASPLDEIVERVVPNCPVVLLDVPGNPTQWPDISADIMTGAVALARHLIELGHRRVGYLGLHRLGRKATLDMRRFALGDELIKAGGMLVGVAELADGPSVTGAAQTVREAWPAWREQGITAIVGEDDLYAYGCLTALRSFGVDVPGEVSVASFNDLPFSQLVSPSLTTVSVPAFSLGLAAAEAIAEITAGYETERRLLPATLHVRDSTGPAPG